jgi:hypothetical protein
MCGFDGGHFRLLSDADAMLPNFSETERSAAKVQNLNDGSFSVKN